MLYNLDVHQPIFIIFGYSRTSLHSRVVASLQSQQTQPQEKEETEAEQTPERLLATLARCDVAKIMYNNNLLTACIRL